MKNINTQKIGNLGTPIVNNQSAPKPAIPTKTANAFTTIYDAISYVKSEDFKTELADYALRHADQKICYDVRPFKFDPDNRVWIITFWEQKVMGPNEVVKNIKQMIDHQLDSKRETQRLQQMVDLDHLLIKKGRVHGRPILIVQLVED